MEVNLIHRIGAQGLYRGEVQFRDKDKLNSCTFLVLAENSEEALAKFKAYLNQEVPSLDGKMCRYTLAIDFVIA